MKRWRLRICRFTPAVGFLFTAAMAVPRPALLFHEHAGGEHVHVHGDELAGEAHEHSPDEHHQHHHADHAASDHHHDADHDDAAFEMPEATHLGHWHSPHPFQRVAPATLQTLATLADAVALAANVCVGVAAPPLLPDRARAPPPATVG